MNKLEIIIMKQLKRFVTKQSMLRKEGSKAEYTIVMGDSSVKIGKCQPEKETTMEKFGVGGRNGGRAQVKTSKAPKKMEGRSQV